MPFFENLNVCELQTRQFTEIVSDFEQCCVQNRICEKQILADVISSSFEFLPLDRLHPNVESLPLTKLLEDFNFRETAKFLILSVPLVERREMIFRFTPECDALLADCIVSIAINFGIWSDSERRNYLDKLKMQSSLRKSSYTRLYGSKLTSVGGSACMRYKNALFFNFSTRTSTRVGMSMDSIDNFFTKSRCR